MVKTDVFSAFNSVGLRKILNLDASIPNLFSTITREDESLFLSTHFGVPALCPPGYCFITCLLRANATSPKKHREYLQLIQVMGSEVVSSDFLI